MTVDTDPRATAQSRPNYQPPKRGRSTAVASRQAFRRCYNGTWPFCGRTRPSSWAEPWFNRFYWCSFFCMCSLRSVRESAARAGTTGESAFATVLVAGVVGISIMFQGIQSVALPMSTEFGYTKEIEDRVLAPMPVWLVAMGKVFAGALQGLLAALIVFPIAALIHAHGVHAHLVIHWLILLTLLPLTCVMCASLGLVLGTRIEPRNIGVMFGLIVLPMTFLGGSYYQWTVLQHVKVGGFPWLQTVVLLNPLIYVTEGFRAALTPSSHMHLYVIYPVLISITVVLLWQGLAGFKRRVLRRLMLAGKRVLILAADLFEDMELLYPLYRLVEEGRGRHRGRTRR